jgi:hypothetical protein
VCTRETQQVADELRRAVSAVSEGNMMKTGHLPGTVRLPHADLLARTDERDFSLRDILF